MSFLLPLRPTTLSACASLHFILYPIHYTSPSIFLPSSLSRLMPKYYFPFSCVLPYDIFPCGAICSDERTLRFHLPVHAILLSCFLFSFRGSSPSAPVVALPSDCLIHLLMNFLSSFPSCPDGPPSEDGSLAIHFIRSDTFHRR